MKKQSGFTFIEAVIVITITGVIAGVVSIFMVGPIKSYFDITTRAEITDITDTTIRHLDRQLRNALPNSVRIGPGSACLEYIPVKASGRYRAEPDCTTGECVGSALQIMSPTLTFDVLSQMSALPVSGDKVVVYNTGDAGSDAYSGDNTASVASASSNQITLTTPKQFHYQSPDHRFQVISSNDNAVTYACSNVGIDTANGDGTGTLYRYSRYGLNAVQPNTCTAPESASIAVVATNVSNCTLTYDLSSAGRYGVIGVSLDITKNNETAGLYHEISINNRP